MKIYKLLLSVIMPFWNFASEVNLPVDLEIRVKRIKSIDEDEIKKQLTEPVRCRDFNKVIEIIKSIPPFKINISAIINDMCLLHLACGYKGNLEDAEYIISQSVDINAIDVTPCGNFGFLTPLGIASANGSLGIIKCLISHNADINARGLVIWGKEIYDAYFSGNFEVVKYLISKYSHISDMHYKYDIGGTPYYKLGNTALEIANIFGHLEIAEYLKDFTGLLLLQEGADDEYGNKIFTVFSELFELENSDEASPLCKFNLIKRKVKELIVGSNWEEILRIQTLRFRPGEKDKLVKPFISVFFTPCQIFQLIYDQYKAIPNTDEMKKFIKVVSREYNLTKVTNANNLNLLHLFASNVDICNFIVSINPKLITMKHDDGNMPCLEAFYKNLLSPDANDEEELN